MSRSIGTLTDMDPDIIRKMFEQGGTLIILGMPSGTEFGIDMESWHIGNMFRGIKMIPPGLHFIYFSARSKDGQTAPRTGFFHMFEQQEVLVKKYDPREEDLSEETSHEEVERIKLNLRNIDQHLGPYPYDLWSKWISFTQHIHSQDLERMHPLSGKINSAPELVNKKSSKRKDSSTDAQTELGETKEKGIKDSEDITVAVSCSSCDTANPSTSNVAKADDNQNAADTGLSQNDRLSIPSLPDMEPKPGTEIRFSKFPEKPYREGATPYEITRGNIDSSYTLQFIFDQLSKPEDILAELQFSFICFMVGQSWDSWEHWRELVVALCKAEDTLKSYPQLYSQVLSILHYQIEEVPEDLFVDIVESSNFLVVCLTTLFANIIDNGSTLPHDLMMKSQKFKRHLTSKFHWNLDLEEEGEDAPVIVNVGDS